MSNEMEWKTIDTAPPPGTIKMFVVKGFDMDIGLVRSYTSDPWCVWREEDGKFARWPHPHPPTHWCELPEDPS